MQLPRWVRRTVLSAAGLLLLALLGGRLLHDQRRHEAVLRAADVVDAVVGVNEAGLGVGGSVVVGIQVSGRGSELRIDAPRLRPAVATRTEVVGAPLIVAADTGSQIRVRLQPNCTAVVGLARLDLELPITPASGRQHLLRVPFADGPSLLRRACGYLPVDEALSATTYYPEWSGDRLELHVGVHNDGRERLTLVGLGAPGLAVQTGLPVVLPPRGETVDLPLVMHVVDCAGLRQVAALTADLVDGSGRRLAVSLPIGEPNAVTFRWFVAERCGRLAGRLQRREVREP